MISRDAIGLPIRIREDNTVDFTDSAFLCGMLSLFGSSSDKALLAKYTKSSQLIRHPTGDQLDQSVIDPISTSRDALIAWSSTKVDDEQVNLTRLNYARKWFVNKDILLPHLKLYLYRQSGHKVDWYNLWLYLVAYKFLLLDILWFCLVSRFQTPEKQHEINQMLSLANSYGRFWLKLFFLLHKSPDENMKDYFCTWRNQSEIYDMYLEWKGSL